MRALVIDSHKGAKDEIPQNLHWQNAKQISDLIGAKLIWSYKGVNDEVETDFDVIVFVHASAYEFVDRAWVEKSPSARLFYVTNEYNLGEARVLWTAAKAGRKYEVIANHQPEISRVCKKYVKDWYVTNLNCLCYNPRVHNNNVLNVRKLKSIYYGSYRKGRTDAFKKYLLGDSTIISTHKKNQEKFRDLLHIGSSRFIDRINWNKHGLSLYNSSLYLEDNVNNTSYNHLANRFYEALNYDIPILFGEECRATTDKAGIYVPDELWVTSSELPNMDGYPTQENWHHLAAMDKSCTKEYLKKILTPC